MQKKTRRAPLALALVALFAAALVPVSGADSEQVLYTFATAPPAPRWTILELNVTQPGITPSVYYQTPEFHCPSYWGVKFLTGPPEAIRAYNGLGWSIGAGRHGADAYMQTPVTTVHGGFLTNDGAEHCLWQNTRVIYGELPLGTVRVFHMSAGVPFDGTATFSVDKPGVQVVGVSSGQSVFYKNETNFARGQSVALYSPPYCGALWESLDCPDNHMNEGSSYSVVAGRDKRTRELFEHRPFWYYANNGRVTVSNASVLYPDGLVRHLERPLMEAEGLSVNSGGLGSMTFNEPPGMYTFRMEQSVNVGERKKAGWLVFGADIWFPGEE